MGAAVPGQHQHAQLGDQRSKRRLPHEQAEDGERQQPRACKGGGGGALCVAAVQAAAGGQRQGAAALQAACAAGMKRMRAGQRSRPNGAPVPRRRRSIRRPTGPGEAGACRIRDPLACRQARSSLSGREVPVRGRPAIGGQGASQQQGAVMNGAGWLTPVGQMAPHSSGSSRTNIKSQRLRRRGGAGGGKGP